MNSLLVEVKDKIGGDSTDGLYKNEGTLAGIPDERIRVSRLEGASVTIRQYLAHVTSEGRRQKRAEDTSSSKGSERVQTTLSVGEKW